MPTLHSFWVLFPEPKEKKVNRTKNSQSWIEKKQIGAQGPNILLLNYLKIIKSQNGGILVFIYTPTDDATRLY